MNSDDQLTLFDSEELRNISSIGNQRNLKLRMSGESLQKWKSQIQKYQNQVRVSQPIAQGTLFDLTSNSIDLETIDPFSLTLRSCSFYRFPAEGKGASCLYFVLDTTAEILLYVGESLYSHKRWQGQHDCKRYLDNYQDLHYRHQIKSTIGMTFGWGAPLQTRPRQRIESALIAKWKSPFNWQNWNYWHTPFT